MLRGLVFGVCLQAAVAAAAGEGRTPKPVVDRLSQAFQKVMENPELRERMVSQGADPAFMGADDFAAFLAAEMPRWAEVVKKSGAKLD